MASKILRGIRQVKDITKFPTNITQENDLVSTEDGTVYVRGIDGYEKLSGIEDVQDDVDNQKESIDSMQTDLSDLQEDVKKNTDNVSEFKASMDSANDEIDNLKSKNESLENTIDDLKSRLDELEDNSGSGE